MPLFLCAFYRSENEEPRGCAQREQMKEDAREVERKC